MSEPSTLALALDLLDPEQGAARPTVEEALRGAATGSVTPARSGDSGSALVALVVLDDGRAYTVPDACPHDGYPISDGFLDGESLVCSRHGWEVEICSGRCPARPGALLHTRRVS